MHHPSVIFFYNHIKTREYQKLKKKLAVYGFVDKFGVLARI